MEPLADGMAVASRVDQVGDGLQVRVQQRGGVLTLFGGKSGEPAAGGLQAFHEVGVDALALQRASNATGLQ